MIIYFNKLFYSLIHWVSILFLVLCGGVEGKKKKTLYLFVGSLLLIFILS